MPHGEATRAVLYGCKSSEDRHGSIPDQLADCRALAEREGCTLVAEHRDEAFSGYTGNRGPGLEQAKRDAIQAAEEHGTSILVVQDVDRLARGAGDQPGAADHLAEVFFALQRHRVQLWSCRTGRLDLLRAALEGERSHAESARKAQATSGGLRRRKQRGQPVGPVPLGYHVEHDLDGTARRVIDDYQARSVRMTFDLVEQGHSPGSAQKRLNALGLTGKRGAPFTSRTVRDLVRNTAYKGEKGYEPIIDPERFDLVNTSLGRLGPDAAQRQQSGRPSPTPFLLRGVARCGLCGSPLYTREQAMGRVYLCKQRRLGTRLCDAPVIPARELETHVLNHLSTFVGSVEQWLGEQAAKRHHERQQHEQAVERQRAHVAQLDRERTALMRSYREHVSQGARTAPLALEAVHDLDLVREAAQKALGALEARLAEWTAPPTASEAEAYFETLVDAITGKLSQAEGPEQLNRTLRGILVALWVEHEEDRKRLLVEFALRESPERLSDDELGRQLGVPVDMVIPLRDRDSLPPCDLRYVPLDPYGLNAYLDSLPLTEERIAELEARERAADPPRKPGVTPWCRSIPGGSRSRHRRAPVP